MFHSATTCSRRSREPALLPEDEQYDDEEHQSEWSDGPPSPERARIDDEGFLDATQLPEPLRTLYQELRIGEIPLRQWTQDLKKALGLPHDDV